MPEYHIEKANFEKQKKELKIFAEQPATSTELDKFETSGQWSDFWSGGLTGVLSGHKVTGDELNSLVIQLQSCFAEINEQNRKVIKEFGQVFETFEALDKGYIQGILIGVKSAEKASQEAKNAQKDVDDTITALQKTINKLKEFKDEVGGYAHLKDIDKIWNDILQLDRDLKIISQKIKEQEISLNKRIAELNQFRTKIEKQEHIKDVDFIWEKVEGFPKDIAKLSKNFDIKVNAIEKDVETFTEFKNSQEHFGDVDKIWEMLQESQKKTQTFSTNLKKLSKELGGKVSVIEKDVETFTEFKSSQEHFSDVDKIWEMLQKIQEKTQAFTASYEEYQEAQHRIDEKLSEIVPFFVKLQQLQHIGDVDDEWEYSHSMAEKLERTDNRISDTEDKVREYEEKLAHYESENLQFKNRMNTAYIIAGSALGISFIQLILLLVGIL